MVSIMSFYLVKTLPNGDCCLARIFVLDGGKDRLELAFHKVGKPRAEVYWMHRDPGKLYKLTTFSSSAAKEYVRGANARWFAEADRLLAAKTAVR